MARPGVVTEETALAFQGPPVGALAAACRSAVALFRHAQEGVQRLDPARLVPPALRAGRSVAFVSVYRLRNAERLQRLLAELPEGTPVRLWALDATDPRLADRTVGVGRGGRMALLNALVAELPEVPDLLVVADDDVDFVVGDVARLIETGARLGFDLFQPAHSRASRTAFDFVRKLPFVVARQTTSVEQGPLLVLSRLAQSHVFPLPEELHMGWGVEVRWHRLAKEQPIRFGIIDSVVIRHVDSVARTYDKGPELARLHAELAELGLRDLRDIQSTIRRFGLVAGARAVRASTTSTG